MDNPSREEAERKYERWQANVRWYSWDSPVGLSIALASLLVSLGLFVWLLHLADILK
jgi:hypothetical protein